MKKYSYLLLIPVLLSGCSQEEEITPQISPPVTETHQISPNPPSNDVNYSSDEAEPLEMTAQTLSAETIQFLTQCSQLLNEFDSVYRNMEEYYTLILEENDVETHLTSFLSEVNLFVDLLEETQGFIPTQEVEMEHRDLVNASLHLANYYKDIMAQLEESDITSQEKLIVLEAMRIEILPFIEDFSNSAFILMVGLGQGNLAG